MEKLSNCARHSPGGKMDFLLGALVNLQLPKFSFCKFSCNMKKASGPMVSEAMKNKPAGKGAAHGWGGCHGK
ncbi:MAG: hypothetical protein JRJ65_09745 [Deltaproteobacteria bacterium]|nr:hypothetical protein [Deltaproteobacteria bacterium]